MKRSRGEVITALEKVRKGLCQYGPCARRCDCKFMLREEDKLFSKEFSGCPELRVAIDMLREDGNKLSELIWDGQQVRFNL